MRTFVINGTYLAAPVKQQGAALIVALVILAVVTVIGVSNMQSTTLEMRMTASMIDRNKAYAEVEAALKLAEDRLLDVMAVREEDLYTDTCDTGQCFTSACTNGLCFYGEWLSTDLDGKPGCEVAPNADSTERLDFWRDSSIWSDADLHETISVHGQDIKVIYEFLCFVEIDLVQPGVGKPLFRVTAYRESESGQRAPVMQQSTYALPW